VLYKAACGQAEGQRRAGPTPRPQPQVSRQPGSQTTNCPSLYKGAWTLRIGRSNPSSSSSRQYSSRSTVSQRVLRIKTKAGIRGFTSSEEGPEPGYMLCHHYPISSRTRCRTPTSPFVKPFLWLLSSKYHDRVITITGCYKKSMECAKASSKMSEALVVVEEKRQLHQRVTVTQPGRPAPS
jgi:hypothetical protein